MVVRGHIGPVIFLSEEEYVESFTIRGEVVPPFLVFVPYEVRDGVPGYWIPVKPDDDWSDECEEEVC